MTDDEARRQWRSEAMPPIEPAAGIALMLLAALVPIVVLMLLFGFSEPPTGAQAIRAASECESNGGRYEFGGCQFQSLNSM